jgi:alpha-galactosidase
MLQIGNPGLNNDEARSHFGAWAIVAAPLLIGADLVSGLDANSLAILSAPEIIAVDQDALGVQGIRVSAANPNGPECWARPLADGSVAALLLNRASTTASVTCTFAELGLKNPTGTASVRDLWQRMDIGNFTSSFTAQNLASHASMVIKVKQ